MGQLLLWSELVVTSTLLFLLGFTLSARIKWPKVRRLTGVFWCLLVLLPWAWVIHLFRGVWKVFPVIGLGPLLSASIVAGLLVLILGILLKIVWTKHALSGEPTAAHWPAGRLAVGCFVMILVTGWSFWALDLAVAQRIQRLHTDGLALSIAATPPPVDPEDNAAPLFNQALNMLETIYPPKNPREGPSSLYRFYENLEVSSDDFDPEKREMLDYLQKAQPALLLIHEAAAKPRCDFGILYTPPSVEILLPQLSDLRAVQILLCASARVHAHKGEMNLALADMRAAEGMSRHASDLPFLVSHMVATGMEAMVFDTYQRLLDDAHFPSNPVNGDWEDHQFSLEGKLPRIMQYNSAMGMYLFQDQQTDILSVALDKIPNTLKSNVQTRQLMEVPSVYRVFYADRDIDSTLHILHRYEIGRASRFYRGSGHWPENPADMAGGAIGPIGQYALFDHLSRHNLQSLRVDAQADLMTLARGMVRYRAANGKYPDDLRELSPKYIHALPVDPFMGYPMKMLNKDGRRIIYSIGPDVTDDQGLPYDYHTCKGDFVIRLPK